MTADLTNRVAVVTGGGGGIGRAIALQLAKCGCNVGIFDVDEAGAKETASQVAAQGRKSAVAFGSVAERTHVNKAIAAFGAALGPTDILVNNAGIIRTAPFLEVTDAAWDETRRVNLDGIFLVSQAALPQMIARKSGAIINLSSWAGKRGMPNYAAYTASKFAVVGLTQSLALEMAVHGIRVNAVCPGIIVDTQMRNDVERLNKEQGLPDLAARSKAIPLGRPGVPDDVAKVVAFLASDDAGYMTGQALNVTGGLWMT